MKLYEFPSGDTVHKYKKSIVISFKGKRNVLSTGPNNGGFTTDLAAVFNNDANPGDGMEVKLRADTYREHMDILAKEDLGLDPSSCSGLMTVASMDNSAISTLFSLEPQTIGTIWEFPPVSKPLFINTFRKRSDICVNLIRKL